MSKLILEGLAKGKLIAKPNTDRTRHSEVYKTIDLIYYVDDQLVKDWYSCSKCFNVFNVTVGNGNKKLRTHFKCDCQSKPEFQIPEGESN